MVKQATGERNFHIFYYLFAGMDSAALERLHLVRAAEEYRYVLGEHWRDFAAGSAQRGRHGLGTPLLSGAVLGGPGHSDRSTSPTHTRKRGVTVTLIVVSHHLCAAISMADRHRRVTWMWTAAPW